MKEPEKLARYTLIVSLGLMAGVALVASVPGSGPGGPTVNSRFTSLPAVALLGNLTVISSLLFVTARALVSHHPGEDAVLFGGVVLASGVGAFFLTAIYAVPVAAPNGEIYHIPPFQPQTLFLLGWGFSTMLFALIASRLRRDLIGAARAVPERSAREHAAFPP